MGFTKKASDSFGNVIESTNYTVLDPVVKARFLSRGNNLVLGVSQFKDPPQDLIYVGKVYESCPSNNMLGADVWLDLSFPHVIYITGTRGSGKSFDLGVLIEGISQLNEGTPIQESITPITSILIDTQNQFWTLKYAPNPNIEENQAQLEALKRWRIRPNALANVRLWIPQARRSFLVTSDVFRFGRGT